jgi:predicted butyrate kinase (DUF1464 family)
MESNPCKTFGDEGRVEAKGCRSFFCKKDPQIIVEVIPDFVVRFTKLKDGEIDAVVAIVGWGVMSLLKIRCNTSIWLMNQSAGAIHQ